MASGLSHRNPQGNEDEYVPLDQGHEVVKSSVQEAIQYVAGGLSLGKPTEEHNGKRCHVIQVHRIRQLEKMTASSKYPSS